MGERGRRSAPDGHWARPGGEDAAEEDRHVARQLRSRRAERSVRRAGARGPEGSADPDGEAERQRRRDRAWPPDRLYGHPHRCHAVVRNDAAEGATRTCDTLRIRRDGHGIGHRACLRHSVNAECRMPNAELPPMTNVGMKNDVNRMTSMSNDGSACSPSEATE